ncbi:sulfur oxidation c-type cytochrome SoxX [Aurantimonas sp. VKM B-3413]|uniref:sulfur oxidation c-type cytochrome SoxX n=1 Tax=Aurantimonas sp. VKM B-3413 TaxID=2779401 RepID=UPI001E5E51B5|nr:sulfur oxidation c-type cytochrome SoxX [Aurantimonas sp. VKM B-3413]MCB8837203.1 sulfur oxidation c-type cytochrome SoxX [Aurantimonas sp. VKM B-3413]
MLRPIVVGCALIVSGSIAGQAAETAPASVSFDGGAVKETVSGGPGDPAEGRKVFVDRGLGNCLACHANKDLSKEQFHGNVGPAVDGVAGRYDAAQLRAIVVNAKKVFGPETVMPGFYTLDVGVDVAEKFKGKTILSADQVEDVVAYLRTLKGE